MTPLVSHTELLDAAVRNIISKSLRKNQTACLNNFSEFVQKNQVAFARSALNVEFKCPTIGRDGRVRVSAVIRHQEQARVSTGCTPRDPPQTA